MTWLDKLFGKGEWYEAEKFLTIHLVWDIIHDDMDDIDSDLEEIIREETYKLLEHIRNRLKNEETEWPTCEECCNETKQLFRDIIKEHKNNKEVTPEYAPIDQEYLHRFTRINMKTDDKMINEYVPEWEQYILHRRNIKEFNREYFQHWLLLKEEWHYLALVYVWEPYQQYVIWAWSLLDNVSRNTIIELSDAFISGLNV